MTISLNSHQALSLWSSVTEYLLSLDSESDLSSRQIAVLLKVYGTDSLYTVRALATELKISKPAVTRALNRLSYFGYIKRKTDVSDRRSIFVQKTVKGSVFLSDFTEAVIRYASSL